MGDAFECDRCEELKKGTPSETIPITIETTNERLVSSATWRTVETELTIDVEVDLCDQCAERHKNFLNGSLGFPDAT